MTNPDTLRLEPCPFCGSEKLAADFSHFGGSIECRDCGCLLPLPTKSPATQAASWNRRAAPASPLGEGWPACQVCGGKIEARICQECGAAFHENNDGALVLSPLAASRPAAPIGAK